jgi:hypothetical protein
MTQIDVVAEKYVPDLPALRRISLLVRRVSEDDAALRRPMIAVAEVVERLKRHVVLGLPLGENDVEHLCSLVERLARKQSKRGRIPVAEDAVLTELHDLARVLRHH